MPRVTLSTGEVVEQSTLAAEGAYPESNPYHDPPLVREAVRQNQLDMPTPGATEAWNHVLIPVLARQQYGDRKAVG